ncbi:MAG: T9SS type A sorting domain-containing protein, partial [Flavobacteriaceae bacterium]|nr:T9SS type A sorting domain-containing protein [Flavobacteriaceae bacterium]
GSDFTGTNGTTITNKDDNWNLVGNPYPSAIRALNFLNANPNIEGAVRIWTHGTNPSPSISDPFYDSYVYNYTPNDYIVYNGTGTLEGPLGFNGFIAGGQSFMINMDDGAATTETVTFNNAMRSRTYNNEQFYRTSNSSTRDALDTNGEEKNRIWLDIINSNNQSARMLVGYVTGATYQKDRVYDAVTNVLANVMNIYSVLDNQRMAIQGRALPFDDSDKVQIAVNITTAGNYSIGIGATDGLFTQNQEIYLEDTQLNIIHDLRTAPYSFSSSAGEFKDRFVLRFTNETLGIEDVISEDSVVVFSQGNNISISSENTPIKSVAIYNLLGQLLFKENNVNSNNMIISKLIKNSQALIVKVHFDNNKEITRKIVF